MHVKFFTKYLEHHKYTTDVTHLLYYTIYHLILLPSLRQNLNAFYCIIYFINYTRGVQFCGFFLANVSVQSVQSLSCVRLCDPLNRSTPGLPVHHHLLEFTQTHLHQVGDAIQPSHPLSSPSPPAPNPSQHQSLFQWVNSSHEVAKLLAFQL